MDYWNILKPTWMIVGILASMMALYNQYPQFKELFFVQRGRKARLLHAEKAVRDYRYARRLRNNITSLVSLAVRDLLISTGMIAYAGVTFFIFEIMAPMPEGKISGNIAVAGILILSLFISQRNVRFYLMSRRIHYSRCRTESRVRKLLVEQALRTERERLIRRL